MSDFRREWLTVDELADALKGSEWSPIETAPKDGTRVQFHNVETGLVDVGHWKDWSGMEAWRRGMLPDFAKDWDGEWSTDYGNGDMTHWRHLEGCR